jgi:hypothetical protein
MTSTPGNLHDFLDHGSHAYDHAVFAEFSCILCMVVTLKSEQAVVVVFFLLTMITLMITLDFVGFTVFFDL